VSSCLKAALVFLSGRGVKSRSCIDRARCPGSAPLSSLFIYSICVLSARTARVRAAGTGGGAGGRAAGGDARGDGRVPRPCARGGGPLTRKNRTHISPPHRTNRTHISPPHRTNWTHISPQPYAGVALGGAGGEGEAGGGGGGGAVQGRRGPRRRRLQGHPSFGCADHPTFIHFHPFSCANRPPFSRDMADWLTD